MIRNSITHEVQATVNNEVAQIHEGRGTEDVSGDQDDEALSP